MSATPAYQALTETYTRLYRYGHVAAMASWDASVNMPANGNEARGAALAEMDVLIHNTETDPKLKQLLAAAEQEPLAELERANLREMRRRWATANLLPANLVEAHSLATSRCEHAWRTQRGANDWAGFVPNLREVVSLTRQQAQLLGDAEGLSPYDALMGRYEPGMRSAEIERIFGDVKTWLPGLIAKVRDKQAHETVIAPVGPFAIDAQRELGLAVMQVLQFDFDGGRLDVSSHPFCGGVPEDVRITTRYREDSFAQSLMGVIHETGHARYEQNLPRAISTQPVGTARSMGIHESQSLSFEMQLGRSAAFLSHIAPLIRQHLGEQPAFAPDNLARLYTRVQPGHIRVDADELCYPAHVILRFEIERALINGEIEVEDIPALWDEKMQAYLGIDTRGDYKDGCMQDIHWAYGLIGYFPSYTLGAMYAAQYFATLRRKAPDLDARLGQGDLAPVFEWLKTHIWEKASTLETADLVRQATGESLNPAHFRAHLEARYLG